MDKNVKSGFRVILLEMIGVLIGVLNGFLLPKALDVDAYAIVKTFGLYIGYAGMLHLGFSDGLYIILGGQRLNKLDINKIKGYFNTMLRIVSIVIVTIALGNFFVIKDDIIYLFLLYSIEYQIFLFVSLLFRATGSFSQYSSLKNIWNLMTLLSVLLVVFVYPDPYFYIWGQIITQLVLMLYSLYAFRRYFGKAVPIELTEIKTIFSLGLSVLLANVISNLIISLDRWFVKLNFSSKEFAFYSFGASMLSLFLALIGSIGNVLYPFLASNSADKQNRSTNILIKDIILIVGFCSIGCLYILNLIVDVFLPEYVYSLRVLSILIYAIPFIGTTNVLFANLFKVNRRTVQFSIISVIMVGVALVVDYSIVRIFNRFDFVAFGTLITYILWFLLCSLDKKIKLFQWKDYFVFGSLLAVIAGLSYLGIEGVLAFIIYMVLIMLLCWWQYKQSILRGYELILKRKK